MDRVLVVGLTYPLAMSVLCWWQPKERVLTRFCCLLASVIALRGLLNFHALALWPAASGRYSLSDPFAVLTLKHDGQSKEVSLGHIETL